MLSVVEPVCVSPADGRAVLADGWRRSGRPPGFVSRRRKRHLAELLATDWAAAESAGVAFDEVRWRVREHAETARVDVGRALDLICDPGWRATVEAIARAMVAAERPS